MTVPLCIFSATTNKVSSEQAALLQLQEERLKIREEKLADDMTALRTEQLKVHELNLSLKDLVKNQQDENERVLYCSFDKSKIKIKNSRKNGEQKMSGTG